MSKCDVTSEQYRNLNMYAYNICVIEQVDIKPGAVCKLKHC